MITSALASADVYICFSFTTINILIPSLFTYTRQYHFFIMIALDDEREKFFLLIFFAVFLADRNLIFFSLCFFTTTTNMKNYLHCCLTAFKCLSSSSSSHTNIFIFSSVLIASQLTLLTAHMSNAH